jgi:DnaJ-class molecular chaperone
MPRELYQDVHPEVDCGECSGAGFFGSGDIVEPCSCCRGKGVLIDEEVMLYPRKPIRRATASYENVTDIQYLGGE